MTSKLQLTVPKAIADQYGICPGDELQWVPAGEVIRVIPANSPQQPNRSLTISDRLALFDQATERQQRRATAPAKRVKTADRGWKREDLYHRGSSD